MRTELIEKDGQLYLVLGNIALPVTMVDGHPRIAEVWSEQRPNAQGGTDCIVHVPCLNIAGEVKHPN